MPKHDRHLSWDEFFKAGGEAVVEHTFRQRRAEDFSNDSDPDEMPSRTWEVPEYESIIRDLSDAGCVPPNATYGSYHTSKGNFKKGNE